MEIGIDSISGIIPEPCDGPERVGIGEDHRKAFLDSAADQVRVLKALAPDAPKSSLGAAQWGLTAC